MRRFARVLLAAVLGMAGAVVATDAQALDVYTTPGQHNHNGRLWKTECEPYSSTVDRCRTEIWAYTVELQNGRYVENAGWAFNNLTYKKSRRSTWQEWNPLVSPGTYEVDSRLWKTECDTQWTGNNACRSMIYATVIEKTAQGFRSVNKYVFNNIVHLTPISCPVSQQTLRTSTEQAGAVIQGCTRSASDPSWTAVDFVVPLGVDDNMMSTALFRSTASGWAYKAHSGLSATTFCGWVSQMGVPQDLAKHYPYCS